MSGTDDTTSTGVPEAARPPVPAFTRASEAYRGTHAPSLSSNRNAAGGQPAARPALTPVGATLSASDRPQAPTGASSSGAPEKPVHRPAPTRASILYNTVQRTNPMRALIRNVPLQLGDIAADFQVGTHAGVLFLSLKYHRLHPEYIHARIEKMRNKYSVRILLVHCDILALRELFKIAIVNDLTVFVAWSNEEAAQYLECFKQYEHKSADTLKERVHQSYSAQLDHVLTSGRKVNKTNAEALAAQFGSFANIARQTSNTLSGVKGIGPTKVLTLLEAFGAPFVTGGGRKVRTLPGSPVGKDKGVGDDDEEDAAREAEASASAHEKDGDKSAPAAHFSPDWPASPGGTPPTPRRPEDTGPSRSPSVGADPERTATGEVWEDPLDGDDDESSEGDSSEAVSTGSKRKR